MPMTGLRHRTHWVVGYDIMVPGWPMYRLSKPSNSGLKMPPPCTKRVHQRWRALLSVSHTISEQPLGVWALTAR